MPPKFVIHDFHRLLARFLRNSKKIGEISIVLLDLMYTYPKIKGVWVLGPFLIWLKLCLLNSNGNLELENLWTNFMWNKYYKRYRLRWFNG